MAQFSNIWKTVPRAQARPGTPATASSNPDEATSYDEGTSGGVSVYSTCSPGSDSTASPIIDLFWQENGKTRYNYDNSVIPRTRAGDLKQGAWCPSCEQNQFESLKQRDQGFCAGCFLLYKSECRKRERAQAEQEAIDLGHVCPDCDAPLSAKDECKGCCGVCRQARQYAAIAKGYFGTAKTHGRKFIASDYCKHGTPNFANCMECAGYESQDHNRASESATFSGCPHGLMESDCDVCYESDHYETSAALNQDNYAPELQLTAAMVKPFLTLTVYGQEIELPTTSKDLLEYSAEFGIVKQTVEKLNKEDPSRPLFKEEKVGESLIIRHTREVQAPCAQLKEWLEYEIASGKKVRDDHMQQIGDELPVALRKMWERLTGMFVEDNYADAQARVIEIEAPAAAGKSYLLVDNSLPNDLILVATADQRKEMVAKLAKANKVGVCVRTTDSATLQFFDKRERFNRVFVDEAFLSHAGLMAMARLQSTLCVIVLGHSSQVRWGCRLPGFNSTEAHNYLQWDMKIRMAANYRSKEKLVWLAGKIYGEWQVPMRADKRGGEIHLAIPSQEPQGLVTISTNKGYKSRGIASNTIHEYQGNEADKLAFIHEKNPHARKLGNGTNYSYTGHTRARDVLFMRFDEPSLRTVYVNAIKEGERTGYKFNNVPLIQITTGNTTRTWHLQRGVPVESMIAPEGQSGIAGFFERLAARKQTAPKPEYTVGQYNSWVDEQKNEELRRARNRATAMTAISNSERRHLVITRLRTVFAVGIIGNRYAKLLAARQSLVSQPTPCAELCDDYGCDGCQYNRMRDARENPENYPKVFQGFYDASGNEVNHIERQARLRTAPGYRKDPPHPEILYSLDASKILPPVFLEKAGEWCGPSGPFSHSVFCICHCQEEYEMLHLVKQMGDRKKKHAAQQRIKRSASGNPKYTSKDYTFEFRGKRVLTGRQRATLKWQRSRCGRSKAHTSHSRNRRSKGQIVNAIAMKVRRRAGNYLKGFYAQQRPRAESFIEKRQRRFNEKVERLRREIFVNQLRRAVKWGLELLAQMNGNGFILGEMNDSGLLPFESSWDRSKLLLLSGDIEMNPGPTTWVNPYSQRECNVPSFNDPKRVLGELVRVWEAHIPNNLKQTYQRFVKVVDSVQTHLAEPCARQHEWVCPEIHHSAPLTATEIKERCGHSHHDFAESSVCRGTCGHRHDDLASQDLCQHALLNADPDYFSSRCGHDLNLPSQVANLAIEKSNLVAEVRVQFNEMMNRIPILRQGWCFYASIANLAGNGPYHIQWHSEKSPENHVALTPFTAASGYQYAIVDRAALFEKAKEISFGYKHDSGLLDLRSDDPSLPSKFLPPPRQQGGNEPMIPGFGFRVAEFGQYYRWAETTAGLRDHHFEGLHHCHPELLTTVKEKIAKRDPYHQNRCAYVESVCLAVAHQVRSLHVKDVVITASDEHQKHKHSFTVNFVTTPKEPAENELVVVVSPILGFGRELGTWRLFGLFFDLGQDVRIQIQNGNFPFKPAAWAREELHEMPAAVNTAGFTNAIMNDCTAISGCWATHSELFVSTMATVSHIYGADEVLAHQFPTRLEITRATLKTNPFSVIPIRCQMPHTTVRFEGKEISRPQESLYERTVELLKFANAPFPAYTLHDLIPVEETRDVMRMKHQGPSPHMKLVSLCQQAILQPRHKCVKASFRLREMTTNIVISSRCRLADGIARAYDGTQSWPIRIMLLSMVPIVGAATLALVNETGLEVWSKGPTANSELVPTTPALILPGGSSEESMHSVVFFQNVTIIQSANWPVFTLYAPSLTVVNSLLELLTAVVNMIASAVAQPHKLVHSIATTTLRTQFIRGPLRVINPVIDYILVLIMFLGFISVMALWGAVLHYRKRGLGIKYPLEENPNGLYSESTEKTSSRDLGPISEQCLIATCGTRGDHVPMTFYGRLNATLGIPTHVWRVHTATHDELAALKKDDFTPWLPSWLALIGATTLGYRWVYLPHVPITGNGENYYLGGTPKWVRATKYGTSVLGRFVSWMSTTFEPHWVIGALSDNNLPRSTDGRTLLRKQTNTGEGLKGWLCGSAHSDNIPQVVKDSLPEITNTNHVDEFRKYDTIIMHGGKGSVDTALACGVSNVIVTDVSMDRDYHTMPTPDDVVDHSILPWIGSLIVAGYKINRPFWFRMAAITDYYWHNSTRILGSVGAVGFRAILMWSYGLSIARFACLVALSIPWLWSVYKSKEVKAAIRTTTEFLWKYPLFVALPGQYATVVGVYLVMGALPKLANDLSVLKNPKTVMVIEQASGMPMPFGHVYFWDKVTGEKFEGAHLGIDGFGERFKFLHKTGFMPKKKSPWRNNHWAIALVSTVMVMWSCLLLIINFRQPFTIAMTPFWGGLLIPMAFIFEGYWREDVAVDDALQVPIPFSTQELREIAANAKEGNYGPWHNCQTVVLGHSFNMGFLSFFFLLSLYLWSLTVLVPGAIANYIGRTFRITICGVDISHMLLTKTRGAAFAAGDSGTTTPVEVASKGQQLLPVNTWIKNATTLVRNAGNMWTIDADETEINYFTTTEEDVLAANLEPSEIEILSNVGYQYNSRAHGIVHKVRMARANRLAEDPDKFRETIERLRSQNVPDEQIPATPAALILANDEHTMQFESLDSIVAQTTTLMHLATLGPHGIHPDAAADIAIRTLAHKIKAAKPIPLPAKPGVLGTEDSCWWVKFTDQLQAALNYLAQLPWVDGFIKWLETRQHKITKYLSELFDFTLTIAKALIKVSQVAWDLLFGAMSILFDNTMGLDKATRIKASWALAGLTKVPILRAKAKFDKAVAFSSFKGRGEFWEDYASYVESLRESAMNTGITSPEELQKVGGPMARPLRFNKPVISSEVANLIGFEEGEYERDQLTEQRAKAYQEEGAPLAGDGAFIRDPDFIKQSLWRYAASYEKDEPTAEEKFREWELCEALFAKYPESLDNMQTASLKEVRAYIKENVSAGAGFHVQRKEAFEAGWDEAIMAEAEKRLLSGEYPPMFHHAFVKSQIVDLSKVIDEGKNLRTVVAEDILTYFMNMYVELERNQRTNPETMMGKGMVLNQNMAGIFETLTEHCRRNGGALMFSDATEFDSQTPKRMWRMLGHMGVLGLRHHKSGNGAAIASVLQAKYDALTDSIIFGVTEPKLGSSVALAIPDERLRTRLATEHPNKFILFDDVKASVPLELDERARQLTAGAPPTSINSSRAGQLLIGDKVLLTTTWDEQYVKQPSVSGNGLERRRNLTSSPTFAVLVSGQHDTTLGGQDYTTLARKDPYTWALKFHENRDLMWQINHKNRGGGTGENATSWDNGWGFKSCYYMGWWKYFDFLPTAHELLELVALANTGDDNISSAALKKGRIDLVRLHECMAWAGLNLDIELVDSVEALDYLGKYYQTVGKHQPGLSVRKPEDVELDHPTLTIWQQVEQKLEAAKRTQRGEPPTAAEFRPIPPRLIVQNTKAILLRRMNVRYYQSMLDGKTTISNPLKSQDRVGRFVGDTITLRGLQFKHATIQRSVGHGALTAFIPSLWWRFAHEYKRDVEDLASWYGLNPRNPESFTVILGTGPEGLPALTLHIKDPKASLKGSRAWQFKAFMQSNKYPDYLKVIRTHMKPARFDPDKHERFLMKLRKSPNPLDLWLREVVDEVGGQFANIPREWHKFMPNMAAFYADETYATTNDRIGQFLLSMHDGKVTSLAQFQSLLQQSPYGACSDAVTAWQNYQNDDYRRELQSRPAYVYGNMVILTSLVYGSLYPLEQAIANVPYLGVAYRLMMFWMLDLPKAYSILSTLYWHARGESSKELSALMPRDMYIRSKRFSVWVTDPIPLWVGEFLPFFHALQFLPEVIDLFSKFYRKQTDVSRGTASDTIKNPWEPLVSTRDGDFQNLLNTPLSPETCQALGKADCYRPLIVSAETGVGKSTMFPYAIMGHGHRFLSQKPRRAWILLPRIILRNQWDSPYDPMDPVTGSFPSNSKYRPLKLTDGVTIKPENRILVSTYGHALNRFKRGELEPGDVLFFDEFHEQSGEMICALEYVYGKASGIPIFALSATPVDIPNVETTFWKVPLKQRFTKELHLMDTTVTNMYAWAMKTYPEHVKNAVIRVTSYKEVELVRDGLAYLNVNSTEVSARTAHLPIPPEGVLVCTQIIDAGINLRKTAGKPSIMFDSGKAIKNIEGQMVSNEWTDASTATQTMGRMGRTQNGDVVVRPPGAGTGRPSQPYSSPSYFESDLYARTMNVPQLVTSDLGPNYKALFIAPGINMRSNCSGNLKLLVAIMWSGTPFHEAQRLYGSLFDDKTKQPEHLAYLATFKVKEMIKPKPWPLVLAELAVRGNIILSTKRLTELAGTTQLTPYPNQSSQDIGKVCNFEVTTWVLPVARNWTTDHSRTLTTYWANKSDFDPANATEGEAYEWMISNVEKQVQTLGKNLLNSFDEILPDHNHARAKAKKKLSQELAKFKEKGIDIKRAQPRQMLMEGLVICVDQGRAIVLDNSPQCQWAGCSLAGTHYHHDEQTLGKFQQGEVVPWAYKHTPTLGKEPVKPPPKPSRPPYLPPHNHDSDYDSDEDDDRGNGVGHTPVYMHGARPDSNHNDHYQSRPTIASASTQTDAGTGDEEAIQHEATEPPPPPPPLPPPLSHNNPNRARSMATELARVLANRDGTSRIKSTGDRGHTLGESTIPGETLVEEFRRRSTGFLRPTPVRPPQPAAIPPFQMELQAAARRMASRIRERQQPPTMPPQQPPGVQDLINELDDFIDDLDGNHDE